MAVAEEGVVEPLEVDGVGDDGVECAVRGRGVVALGQVDDAVGDAGGFPGLRSAGLGAFGETVGEFPSLLKYIFMIINNTYISKYVMLISEVRYKIKY